MSKPRAIGCIANSYGGFYVKEENGKYFWAIEDYDGLDDSGWDEIPEYLFAALNRYQNEYDEAEAMKPQKAYIRMQIHRGKLCQVGYEIDSCDPENIATVVRRMGMPPNPYRLEGRTYEVSMLKSDDLSDDEIQAQARKLIEELIKTEEANLPPCPF